MPETNETVLVSSVHGTVWLLDAQTGAIRWQYLPNERIASLIHGGDMVYVASYMPFVAYAFSDAADKQGMSPPRRIPAACPGTITALHASDGTEAWSKSGWTWPVGKAALDGDTLVTDMLGPEIGSNTIDALDKRTGEHLRAIATGEWNRTHVQLITATNGRTLVDDNRGPRHLSVHDTATGEKVWENPRQAMPPGISADGTLLVYGQDVLRTANGAVYATGYKQISFSTPIADGIAYLTTPVKKSYPPAMRISAVRLADNTILWNTPPMAPGTLQNAGNLLLSSRNERSHKSPEFVAIDRLTGNVLWRWIRPRGITGLLWLWSRNLPLMFAKAINEVRWALEHLPHPGQTRGSLRNLWHAIRRGQWRRPAYLGLGPVIVGDLDNVYEGTSLGLFAVNARTGRLRWHALPTMHIAHIVPAPSLK